MHWMVWNCRCAIAASVCFACMFARNVWIQLSPLQGKAYTETEGDEVEDLYRLLSHAKQTMPEIQAVSSGAIASDYQRLRVEHVRQVGCPQAWHDV